VDSKKTNGWAFNKAGVKRKLLDTVKAGKLAYDGERDSARNNARCTQARKTTHGLDGQHQDVDRTPRGRVIRYDTRCYFNVRSKADISELNLPHGTDS